MFYIKIPKTGQKMKQRKGKGQKRKRRQQKLNERERERQSKIISKYERHMFKVIHSLSHSFSVSIY